MFYILLYVAAEVRDDGQVLIHFDGWSNYYDYWTDPTHTDIHPIGWFGQCGHKYQQYKQQLQPPKGKSIALVVALTFAIILIDCS